MHRGVSAINAPGSAVEGDPDDLVCDLDWPYFKGAIS